MRFPGLAGLVFLSVTAIPLSPADAQDIRSERVGLEQESDRTVIEGDIRGAEIVDYRLAALEGQQLIIELETDNLSNYFNLLVPGASEALHSGSRDGGVFAAVL